MTPSDELFHLIKSLSPSEKRYFKVHASRHVIGKSNHYEKLFDALDALPDDKDYDEAAFKRTLRGKSYGKNLSDEKTHLREILLRAMRVYHAERTPKGRLVEMIHEINFLYSKGFVKNCQHQIEKAIKLATDTEQYTELLVLNDFLVRLYRENPAMAPYTVAEMEQQEQQIMQRITLTREAVYLRMKMTEIQTSQQWQKKETDAKQCNNAHKKRSPLFEKKLPILCRRYLSRLGKVRRILTAISLRHGRLKPYIGHRDTHLAVCDRHGGIFIFTSRRKIVSA